MTSPWISDNIQFDGLERIIKNWSLLKKSETHQTTIVSKIDHCRKSTSRPVLFEVERKRCKWSGVEMEDIGTIGVMQGQPQQVSGSQVRYLQALMDRTSDLQV